MITEEEKDKSIEYLVHSCADFAGAKADRIFKEQILKTVKSTLFLEESGTVVERESKALANSVYMDALLDYRDAVQCEEKIKAYRAGAEMKIDVWRSEDATRRAARV